MSSFTHYCICWKATTSTGSYHTRINYPHIVDSTGINVPTLGGALDWVYLLKALPEADKGDESPTTPVVEK